MFHKRAKLLLMRSRSSFPCCSHFLGVAEDKLSVLGNSQKSVVNPRLPMDTHVCSCMNTQTYVPKRATFFSSQTGLVRPWETSKVFVRPGANYYLHHCTCTALLPLKSHLSYHNLCTPPVLEYWQLWRLRSFSSPRKDNQSIPFPTQRITWSQRVISEWFSAVSGWLQSKALSFCLQISKVSVSPSPFCGLNPHFMKIT